MLYGNRSYIFTQSVLTRCSIQLGINDDLGDPIFTAGQLADASKNLIEDGLSDPGVVTGSTTDPAWDPSFKQTIHGCILVTGDSMVTVAERLLELDTIFAGSYKKLLTVDGNVRPGAEAGHEHFGFQDGLSQPPIIGFRNPNTGEDPTRKIYFRTVDGYLLINAFTLSGSTWRHSPWRTR